MKGFGITSNLQFKMTTMEAIDCPEDLRIRFDKVEREKERKKIPVRSMFFFAKSEMQKIVN